MRRGSLLIGDLGGTNARFALANRRGSGFGGELTLECAEYESAEDAIGAYLERAGAPRPEAICLAVAAPVVGPRVCFLNNDWRLDRRDLSERFPGARIRLVNDFTAAAYAVPLLGVADLDPVGAPAPAALADKDFALAVLGPGTGLGVGGLMRSEGNLVALSSEGGHSGFAPESEAQSMLLRQLRECLGRVSNERLLSGPGICNIYRALQRLRGQEAIHREAAEIFRRAIEGDEIAEETERLFFEILGQVAGDLVLTLGAYDGVYIAGGIVKRYPDRLGASPFRTGFENKGRYRDLMRRIPTCLITHPNPGLLGAAHLVRLGANG